MTSIERFGLQPRVGGIEVEKEAGENDMKS